MEKIEDIRPTAELSPEMIKTICDAISQLTLSSDRSLQNAESNISGVEGFAPIIDKMNK